MPWLRSALVGYLSTLSSAARQPASLFHNANSLPRRIPVTVTSSTYDPILRRVISAHKERQALALTSFLAERLALSVHGLLANEPYAVGNSDRLGAHPLSSANGPSQGIRCHRLDGPTCGASPPGPVPDDGSISTDPGTAGRRSGRTGRSSPSGESRRRFPAAEADLGRCGGLVDDLVTTGSSLTEAARVLRAAGITVLGAATVAATVRVRPPNSPQHRRRCSRTENSVRIGRNR